MKNYVCLLKDFLIYKLHTLDDSKAKPNFDAIEMEEELEKTKNIDEVHEACKTIAKNGLKQISTLFSPLKVFYNYLNEKEYILNDVDTDFLKHFINKVCIDLELSYGTRSNYKNSITAFCNFTDKNDSLEYKFNIEKFKVESLDESSKPKTEPTDWLDTPTFSRANKEILGYFKKEDKSLNKYRDILIFRLFSFSGILPNEMASLTIDSFVFKDDEMILKIDGMGAKKREIPLPKRKLIVYYNAYEKLRDKTAKTFFYSPKKPSQKIDTKLLELVVKRMLDFLEVDVRNKTPKMLRKSYAIILNNEKNKETGLTQPEQNIKYLLGLSNTTQLRELLKYATIEVATASKVFEDMEI